MKQEIKTLWFWRWCKQ